MNKNYFKTLILLFTIIASTSCSKKEEYTPTSEYSYFIKILDSYDSTAIEGVSIYLKESYDPFAGNSGYTTKAGCTDFSGEWSGKYNSRQQLKPFKECNSGGPEQAPNYGAKNGVGLSVIEYSDNYWVNETVIENELKSRNETIYVEQFAFIDIVYNNVNLFDSIDSLKIKINDIEYIRNCNKPRGDNPHYLDPPLGKNQPLYWRQNHIIKWKTKYDSNYHIDSVYIDDIYEYNYTITY